MQWIFAFLAAIVAAGADENVWVWALLGYLTGVSLKSASRITELERRIGELQAPAPIAYGALSEPEIEAESLPSSILDKKEECADKTTAWPEPSEPPAETVDPWMAETPLQKEAYEPESFEIELPEREPSDLSKLFRLIWSWFTDGNTFVRVGIVILFVGVSFLLNLAIDRGYIAIELRLAMVAAAAIALLVFGWRLREKRGGYALLIQGGAVGLLYLTVFAAYNLYGLLPSLAAFALMILLVALSTALAVMENALSLALFGSIGGFLAPILTSSGTNNYIGLFSFYAVLNAGIFAVAWFKAWRVLNLVGFAFTFSIGAFWGASEYRPENFSTVEPFLVLFFLFYVGIALLYATRRAPDFKDYIDGTLNFGTPILAFGLQAAMVNDYEYGVAISAFAMGLFYLALAAFVWRRFHETLRFMSETLLSISVIFITLAIPFAVDGSTTSATWAVESTGVLWVGIRQRQFVRRAFALVLQFFAGFALLSDVGLGQGPAFANSGFIGVVIISVCGGISSWLLSADFPERRGFERLLSPVLLAYSLLWLFIGYNYQIEQHGLISVQNDLMLLLTLVLIVLLSRLGKKLSWCEAEYGALSMMLPLTFGAVLMLGTPSHPAAGYGWLLWPAAFAAYLSALKSAERISTRSRLNLHLYAGVFFALLLFWEGFWQLLLVATLLALLFNELAARWQWPELRVLALGLFPVMVFLTVAELFTYEMHPFLLPDTSMDLEWPYETGFLLWPSAFAVLYRLFYDDPAQNSPPSFRGLSLLLAVILPTWEASWHLSNHLELLNAWHLALFPILAAAALYAMQPAQFQPFSRFHTDYLKWSAKPLSWGLVFWSFYQLTSPADSEPLPWLPLLNPADLMQIAVITVVLRFIWLLPEQDMSCEQKRKRYKRWGGFVFLWLNIVLLRTVHHWADYPWSADLLFRPLTQTCLSIFWALTGLSLTIAATRKQIRTLWLTGAVLLSIVVLKLFLFDLQAHDSMERIISFISVGALLMLIGYFAPLPPKPREPSYD